MSEVRTWNIGPERDTNGREKRRWTHDEVQIYHLQSIAVSLERIAERMALNNETLDRIGREKRAVEEALRLQQYRRTVEELLGERGHMPLQDFASAIYRLRIGVFAPLESIPLTDYLALEPAGRGYRVRLVREEAAGDGS